MTRIFVDSAYYVALLNESDHLHDLAVAASCDLRGAARVELVTTD